MARVPTIAEEDAKRPNRERDCLVGERTRIVNRIKSTLARLGIRTSNQPCAGLPPRVGLPIFQAQDRAIDDFTQRPQYTNKPAFHARTTLRLSGSSAIPFPKLYR